MKKIPLIDLAGQYRSIKEEIDTAVQNVFDSGHFVLGPNVAALEKEIAAYSGTEYAVGVASGTDALILGLKALGIGSGDEVIVPAYTFFASVGSIMQVGATPVFAEVRPDTYCFDVKSVAAKITPRTKAIMPVHLYGHPADMDALLNLAKQHNLYVIEDNAQGIGAEYKGRKTGSFGDIGCLSFFPSKNLGGFGDGGMITTNNSELADKVRMLRTHGWRKKYDPEFLGYNSRLDELQAAILRVKLRHIDRWNERRRELATEYGRQLVGLNVGLPYADSDVNHVYHLYIIRVSNRSEVEQQFKQEGIDTAVYYPIPPHLTKPCQAMGYAEGSFPVSEQASKETLAIPIFPEMNDEQIQRVVTVLKKCATPVSVSAAKE